MELDTIDKLPLFKYQKEGAHFLVKSGKAILADAMGIGKTRQAAAAALTLTRGGVVICTASTKTSWAREILILDPDATIHIADSGGTYEYHSGVGSTWYVTNYDILNKQSVASDIAGYMPTTVILDEAHYIKNKKAIRTQAALDLTKQALNVFLLTGTPILNRPIELYTLLEAVGHELTQEKGGYSKYAVKYCAGVLREIPRWIYDPRTGKKVRRVMRFMDTNGASNLDELAKKISNAYLRRTKEILGDKLPQKIIDNVIVDIAPEYRREYEQAWDTYIQYLLNAPKNSKDAERDLTNVEMARHVIELNKLKQVASRGKIPYVVDAAESIIEQGEKVIIFTQYRDTLARIVEELKARKIRGVKLSGDDDAQGRQRAVDYFQNDERIRVFVGNIKAAGVGITLTKASTVLFADMEWTPALHSQAEDRAHRIGQSRLVNVHYYIAKNTVDEDIVELLGKKQQVIDKVLAGEAGTSRDVTKDAIKRILKRAHAIHS